MDEQPDIRIRGEDGKEEEKEERKGLLGLLFLLFRSPILITFLLTLTTVLAVLILKDPDARKTWFREAAPEDLAGRESSLPGARGKEDGKETAVAFASGDAASQQSGAGVRGRAYHNPFGYYADSSAGAGGGRDRASTSAGISGGTADGEDAEGAGGGRGRRSKGRGAGGGGIAAGPVGAAGGASSRGDGKIHGVRAFTKGWRDRTKYKGKQLKFGESGALKRLMGMEGALTRSKGRRGESAGSVQKKQWDAAQYTDVRLAAAPNLQYRRKIREEVAGEIEEDAGGPLGQKRERKKVTDGAYKADMEAGAWEASVGQGFIPPTMAISLAGSYLSKGGGTKEEKSKYGAFAAGSAAAATGAALMFEGMSEDEIVEMLGAGARGAEDPLLK